MEENGLNIRRICRVRIPLSKMSIGWADGTELRAVVTMAGIDHIVGSRMAEWLRLRALEENGLSIRRICRVRIPLPKKSIGWADGTELRPVVTMAVIDHIYWAAGWPSG